MLRVALLSAVLVASGCGSSSSRPGGGAQPPATASGPLDPYGDPPSYGGNPFAGFGQIVTIAVPGGTAEPVTETGNTGGFSVQVAACSTPEAAASLAGDLRGLLEQHVFVDVEGGYHKVRVGSFESREQATALQASVRALGYSDAWVVERQP